MSSLSKEEKSIEFVFGWYQDQSDALRNYKNEVVQSILIPPVLTPKFFGYTLSEIEEHFEENVNELERLVCFDLISATEGALRVDFYSRIAARKKTDLTRDFKQIRKEKEGRISLEQDIIEKWKEYYPAQKRFFSDLTGLLKYRHWLAHGRYWVPKLGKDYDVESTYSIVEEVMIFIKNN